VKQLAHEVEEEAKTTGQPIAAVLEKKVGWVTNVLFSASSEKDERNRVISELQKRFPGVS
jgi:hypothetical protein